MINNNERVVNSPIRKKGPERGKLNFNKKISTKKEKKTEKLRKKLEFESEKKKLKVKFVVFSFNST